MIITQPFFTQSPLRRLAELVARAQESHWSASLSDSLTRSGQLVRSSILTDTRTAPGWLSVRGPVAFIAGRGKTLGTEFEALFESMLRVASRWLSARASQNFQEWETAVPAVRENGRLACLDFSIKEQQSRRPLALTAGTAIFQTKQLSENFLSEPSVALGTASRLVDEADPCAAPGWLSAQAPVHFSETNSATDYHLPVFPEETATWMAACAGKLIIDGTLGGGGHSELFLKAGARVIGVDRDPEALAHAHARLASYGERFTTWQGNFSTIDEIPEIQQGTRVDGILMDLGVSSHQLDTAARGFSFMREGPLDMRMGPSSPYTAAAIVNEWSEEKLIEILFELGEEPKARRIASAIIKRRAEKPFSTTLDLANCIERAIGRHGKTHPATRTFQAIRIAVNEELESLTTALHNAPSILKPGGRLLIITFHSLEDRIVKRFFKHRSTPFIDDPSWPEPRPNPDYQFDLLVRKAILPSSQETSTNPRARSAKLRVAQLLPSKP